MYYHYLLNLFFFGGGVADIDYLLTSAPYHKAFPLLIRSRLGLSQLIVSMLDNFTEKTVLDIISIIGFQHA